MDKICKIRVRLRSIQYYWYIYGSTNKYIYIYKPTYQPSTYLLVRSILMLCSCINAGTTISYFFPHPYLFTYVTFFALFIFNLQISSRVQLAYVYENACTRISKVYLHTVNQCWSVSQLKLKLKKCRNFTFEGLFLLKFSPSFHSGISLITRHISTK